MRAAFKLLTLLAALVLAVPAMAEDVVSPRDALTLAQSSKALLVDVRTPMEWTETGIPAGAATASWGQPNFLQDVLKVAQGDRHAPLVLICRTGNRSGRALALLRDNGFTHVSHVAEGMLGSAAGPGWLARGLPVTAWKAN